MGIRKSDLEDIAEQVMGDEYDEVWIQDIDQEPHYHHGQTSGEKHVDAYHAVRNNDGTISIDKYHSDDD